MSDDTSYGVLPPARYVQVALGFYEVCALREDRTVACAARPGAEPSPAPNGRFVRLAAFSGGFCGIRADGAIQCFDPSLFTLPPEW